MPQRKSRALQHRGAQRQPHAAAGVALREVRQTDLESFFEHQSDLIAIHMASFTAKDPPDKSAFVAKWMRILGDPSGGVTVRTILLDGCVVGSIATFVRTGRPPSQPEVTYWIGREHWGKGIATAALRAFLLEVKTRPIYAGAARDNVASLRVLQKCGFRITGYERAFANARGTEIEEAILMLE